jgi:hypothetical protein
LLIVRQPRGAWSGIPKPRALLLPKIQRWIFLAKDRQTVRESVRHKVDCPGSVHLLRHLEHFLSSFLSSKEFYAALIGAVIGGLLTGRYAIRAQDRATLAQKDRDRETEREAVKTILRAVKAELKTFHDKCLVKLEEVFKAREKTIEAQKPLGIAPLKQNYFVVFDSNAAALGKVNDPKNPELLANIVTTYSAARSLLDSINYNNQRYSVP